jgi:hypothetical protein
VGGGGSNHKRATAKTDGEENKKFVLNFWAGVS